jgi:type II secretory pathway pseudopilin PulG
MKSTRRSLIIFLLMVAAVATWLTLTENKQLNDKLKLASIANALELYRKDSGYYPSQSDGLKAFFQPPAYAPAWRGPYLREHSIIIGQWGHPYIYVIPVNITPMDTISLPWGRMGSLERPMTSLIGLTNESAINKGLPSNVIHTFGHFGRYFPTRAGICAEKPKLAVAAVCWNHPVL